MTSCCYMPISINTTNNGFRAIIKWNKGHLDTSIAICDNWSDEPGYFYVTSRQVAMQQGPPQEAHGSVMAERDEWS